MIEFKCHSCGASLKVSESNAGKMGKCQTCGARIQVPLVSEANERPGQVASQGVRAESASDANAAGPLSERAATHGVAGKVFLHSVGLLATDSELYVVKGPIKLGLLIPAAVLIGLTTILSLLDKGQVPGGRIGPVPIISFFLGSILLKIIIELAVFSSKTKAWVLFEQVLGRGMADESSLSTLREGACTSVHEIKTVKRLKYNSKSRGLDLPSGPAMRVAPNDVTRAEDLAAFIASIAA